MKTIGYAELQITSNFSFLRGASHPNELAEQAAKLGYTEIAITDRNTFAGIVRAHAAAKKSGIRLIPACRLDLLDGPSLLAYPTDRQAYERLSSLITVGNFRAEKGECFLYKKDVYEYKEGSKFIVVDAVDQLEEYKNVFGNDLYIAATRRYDGDDAKHLHRVSRSGIKMVATNDVHYHDPGRRELQDVVTCV